VLIYILADTKRNDKAVMQLVVMDLWGHYMKQTMCLLVQLPLRTQLTIPSKPSWYCQLIGNSMFISTSYI